MFHAIALACALFAADEPKKPEKPLTPRQQQEAAEKVIKDKMAPIEKELAEQQEDYAIAKAAVIGKGNSTKSGAPHGRKWHVSFRTAEQKREVTDKYEGDIKKTQSKLKPLQDELAALKKKPITEPKPTPEAPKEPTKP